MSTEQAKVIGPSVLLDENIDDRVINAYESGSRMIKQKPWKVIKGE